MDIWLKIWVKLVVLILQVKILLYYMSFRSLVPIISDFR